MSTYVLIPGAGSDSWFWHRVVPLLQERGHDVVTPELPCDDPDAGFAEYTRAVLEAIGDRGQVVLVAQSLGGLTAPLVAAEQPVAQIVYVNAMIPVPGKGDWWREAGYPLTFDEFDEVEIFLHDVPPEIVAESEHHIREQNAPLHQVAWPLGALPEVPSAFVLSREDRFFPAEWMRGLVRERLGVEPYEIAGGHCPSLSRPRELVDALEAVRA